MEEDLEPKVNYSKVWNTKRSNILQKYTTVEKLTIVSSYLPSGEKGIPTYLQLSFYCSKQILCIGIYF